MNQQASVSSLEFLAQITEYISKSIDLAKVLPIIINKVKLYLNCEQVFICYFNPDGDEEIITDEILDPNQNNFKEILKQYLSEEDTLIEVKNDKYNASDDFVRNQTTKPVFKAELIIPIFIKSPEVIALETQALWGLFFAYDYDKSRVWEEEETQTIKQVIELIILGIERQLLYGYFQLQTKRLKENEIIDPLTQLPNSQSFIDCLAFEWARLAREKKPLSLIIISVNFQDLSDNDLQESIFLKIAESLLEMIKRPLDLACHYSTTEFTVILPETDTKGATIVAHKISKVIQKNLSDYDKVLVNFCVISCTPPPKSDYKIILEAAENCLQEAIDKKININVTEIN